MSSLCGEHQYGNITKAKMDQILEKLKANGSVISGTNPWDVDVKSNGVKLHGSWNEEQSVLTISVSAKRWYVPCSKIWDTIDPLAKHISELP